jgi:homopolymeric O-antigen transport system ATP-binding protein
MDQVIQVRGLTKRYRLGERQAYYSLREDLMRGLNRAARRLALAPRSPSPRAAERETSMLALHDVSFSVTAGEVLGIIGRNGAGKSTLLKILARVTAPTAGRIELYGRVASLLEIGAGFHPELTGRDNLFLSGAILGMRRAEIARKFDEIVAFAEVEKFIDTPLKRYSSGMYLRLAFAVAAHLEPEILLVDEVLAVGDAAFQKRCLGKIGEVARGGRTVLFVSHNLASIEALCRSCMLLQQGRIVALGNPTTIIERYLTGELVTARAARDLRDHQGRTRASIPIMTGVRLVSSSEGEGAVRMGDRLVVRATFEADRPLRPTFAVTVKAPHGGPIFGVSNRWTRQGADLAPVTRGEITCEFPRLPLMPGAYSLDLYFGDFGDPTRDLDVILDAAGFEVLPADVYGTGMIPRPIDGPVFCDAAWSFSDGAPGRAES